MSDDSLDMMLNSGAELGSLREGRTTRTKIADKVDVPRPNGDRWTEGVSQGRMRKFQQDVTIQMRRLLKQGWLASLLPHKGARPASDEIMTATVLAVGKFFVLDIVGSRTTVDVEAIAANDQLDTEFTIDWLSVGEDHFEYKEGEFTVTTQRPQTLSEADKQEDEAIPPSETTGTKIYYQ